MSPPAAVGLDGDHQVAELAALAGLPREPDVLADLCAAIGASTGLGSDSPLVVELTIRVVSAIRTVLLADQDQDLQGAHGLGVEQLLLGEPSSLGSGIALPVGDQVALQATRFWRELVRSEAKLRLVDRGSQHDVAREVPETAAWSADGQVCTVLAVDIAGFTRTDRDDIIRRHLRDQLYRIVPEALDASSVPWARCHREDRGDGLFVVVPPEIPAKSLLGSFPEQLAARIHTHNHLAREAACMQLRAAVHVGPVEHDGHGIVSTDVNFLFRMLEARPLKQLLATSGAGLALAVSDYVYRTFVCRDPSIVFPGLFRDFRFQVKQTRDRAWAYLPGRSGDPAPGRCLGLGSGLASRDAVRAAVAA
jgi:hypothetical protein